MIAVALWREFRLSIAEIYAIFPTSKLLFANKEIAIFDTLYPEDLKERFHTLWWSIKCINLRWIVKDKKWFLSSSISLIEDIWDLSDTWKFCFAIASYWMDLDLFTLWIQLKKELNKTLNIKPRLVNKNSGNINAATYKKEWLWKGWIELNIIEADWNLYFWETIAFQDVDLYAARDMNKARDMQIWMLPPKLAQIMVNLSWKSSEIYDPFCWLWTVLVESHISWKNKIYWSDLNPQMVEASKTNTKNMPEVNVFRLDATEIEDVNFLKWNYSISIVSEWYLWSIMTKWHVTEEKILKERQELSRLYTGFFSWLKKLNFTWNIVISFPFWTFKGKYMYFEEIYKILDKTWFKAKKLLPNTCEFKETRSGSLLYHRPNQQVWREIFLLNLDS